MLKVTKTYGEEQPAYFVIAQGGEAPKKKHFSRIAASKEAQRLARENPGRDFHVVKLKESFTTEDVSADDDEGMVGGSNKDSVKSAGDVFKTMAINALVGVLANAIRKGGEGVRVEDEEQEVTSFECDMDSPDLTDEERAENEATLAEARERAEDYTVGEDVIVIVSISPLPGLIPHNLVRAKFLGISAEDNRYADVLFNTRDDAGNESTKEDRVNISRLFHEDDAEMRENLGLSERA
jgi:hypothetical protein